MSCSRRSKSGFSVTDGPTYIASLQIGNNAKKVIDHIGSYAGMPAVVSDLEGQLDAISGDESGLEEIAIPWLRCARRIRF